MSEFLPEPYSGAHPDRVKRPGPRHSSRSAPNETTDPIAPAVGTKVKAFYEELPFNHWRTARAAAEAIRTNPVRNDYPDLHRLLKRREVRRVMEAGCGAGWLACSLARHYSVEVTALDFCATALARAERLAAECGVTDRVRFVHRDLLDEHPESEFDLVVSLGVLHHTGAARRAFGGIRRAARVDGHVYVGLYHEHGRQVFMDLFRGILATQGEDAAFRRFCELASGRGSDEEHLRSWFRDQVLHPHETLHTLREIAGWLEEDGLELESTSINRFQPFDELESLFAMEPGYAERSRQANLVEGRFFPGFFTFLARRVVG